MVKGLFQFIFGMLRLAFFGVVLVLIFHTWAIKQFLSFSLSHVLGADVFIQDVKMDWKNTGFEIHDLEIGNPYNFPREKLADIPLVIISADVASLLQGKLHLKTVGFHLRELRVIKVPKRGLNVLELKPLQKAKEIERSSFSWPRNQPKVNGSGLFSIDELIFSMGDIKYLDMSSGITRQNIIHASIRGATYYDIRGADGMVVIVVTEALKKMGLEYLNEQLQKIQNRYLSNIANDMS